MNEWLGQTALSLFMQDNAWLVAAVQTVHILGLATIFTTMLMLDLRLLGMAGRGWTIGEMSRRFVPALWPLTGVMAATGALLVVAEPDRELGSPVFWFKMATLVVALALTGWVARQDDLRWANRPALAKVAGLLLFACWLAIVWAGRWIAYYDVM